MSLELKIRINVKMCSILAVVSVTKGTARMQTWAGIQTQSAGRARLTFLIAVKSSKRNRIFYWCVIFKSHVQTFTKLDS